MTALRRSYWYGLMIVTLLLGLAWINASRLPAAEDDTAPLTVSPRVGFLAPDFTLATVDGQEMRLGDLRGQVVVINFWATWCPPCRAEMPAIEQVYRRHQEAGMVVLAVNQMEPQDQVVAFVQRFGLTFPILLDSNGTVGRAYRVRGLPTTFFIDRFGVIQDVVIGGPMNEATIESRVQTLLEG